MRRKTLAIAIMILAVAIAGASIFIARRSTDTPPIAQKQQPAPQTILKDYAGREVHIADFQGKVLLANVWASWCPFCKDELKHLAAIQKEFGEAVAILAINRAEPADIAKAYSNNLGLGNNLFFLLDPDGSFYQAIGGFSMPETIFIAKDGAIRFHKRGPMNTEGIRRHIQDLLQPAQ